MPFIRRLRRKSIAGPAFVTMIALLAPLGSGADGESTGQSTALTLCPPPALPLPVPGPGMQEVALFASRSLGDVVGPLKVSTGKGTREVLLMKASHGLPIFPPECYVTLPSPGKPAPSPPPDYCILGFDPTDYHCRTGETLFWRRSIITEYYSGEGGNNKGAFTQRRLSEWDPAGAGGSHTSSVSADPQLAHSEVFIPNADAKGRSGAGTFHFRVDDTGARSYFDVKGDPILDYPLTPGQPWEIPPSAYPGADNKNARKAVKAEARPTALRIDVRTTHQDSLIQVQGAPWWVGICRKDSDIIRAEAERRR